MQGIKNVRNNEKRNKGRKRGIAIIAFKLNILKKLSYYHSQNKVKYQKTKSGLIINVDVNELNEIDTIIKLEI